MKIYIESIEDVSGKEIGYEGDFIKEEVTDTEKKAIDQLKLKEKGGKTYKLRRHLCYHEENLPCVPQFI